MTMAPNELQNYIRYGERLSQDLQIALDDLEFRRTGGEVYLALDFSEVHAFLMPSRKLDESWLWPGLDDERMKVVEHSALSKVLTESPKPLLLAPYLLEFQNFLSRQRSEERDRQFRELSKALDTLDSLTDVSEADRLRKLATAAEQEQRALTPEELSDAVAFFEQHAANLVALVRGELLGPIERTQAFLEKKPFGSLSAVAGVQLTGQEPAVVARFDRLRQIRGGENDGASYVDALALEYVKRTNEDLIRRRAPRRILFVSRSNNVRKLVESEMARGLWPSIAGGFIRHPRVFAPLAWQERSSPSATIDILTSTKASLDLCLTSAKLKSAWSLDSRGDAALQELIDRVKDQVISLVQMAGGLNESRIAVPATKPGDSEILRLLSMLRNRAEVFNAVSARMSAISAKLNRDHELLGVMVQTADDPERDVAFVTPARDERMVLPKMGRLAYGIRLSDAMLAQLEQLHDKPHVTHDDLLELFTIATRDATDHYETLLFMAYVLALVGLFSLAADYCETALLSASSNKRTDMNEALFLHAVCRRYAASNVEHFQDAARTLQALREQAPDDLRYVVEEAALRLTHWRRAQEDKKRWKQQVPDLASCIDMLVHTEQLVAAAGEKRLLAFVRNNVCYAHVQAFRATPTPESKRRANEALQRLFDILYEVQPDKNDWPVRMKDTILETSILLNEENYDTELCRQLIESLERDLPLETNLSDRRFMEGRIKTYRDWCGRPR